MRAVFTIAVYTLREHVRRKLVGFFLAGAAAATIGFMLLVPQADALASFLPGGEAISELAALSLFSLFATIATLAFAMGNVGQAYASGEAMLVLSRPVSRAQYVLGKVLASYLATWGMCIVLGLASHAIALVEGKGDHLAIAGHWGAEAFNLTLLATITTLLSAAIPIGVVAAVAAYFCGQVIAGADQLERFVQAGQLEGPLATVVRVGWLITPKYLPSPLAESVIAAVGIPGRDGLWLGAWALAWLFAAVGLSIWVVRAREA